MNRASIDDDCQEYDQSLGKRIWKTGSTSSQCSIIFARDMDVVETRLGFPLGTAHHRTVRDLFVCSRSAAIGTPSITDLVDNQR